MTRTIRISALVALGALVAAAVAPGASAAPAPQHSDLLVSIAAKAQAAGVDPAQLFAGRITVPRAQADHTFAMVETTVGDAIDELGSIGGVSKRDSGPAGTPEIAAGDTLHAWINSGSGSQLLAVSESALVPATPTVLLPPPATILAIEYGGPLTHIVGSYDFGLHTAGTLIGSSVDTGPGAPNGAPVWLPVVSTGFLTDNAIDFLGHGLFFQSQFCLFGFCVAAGGLLGDGVMIFDNTLPLGLPSIP